MAATNNPVFSPLWYRVAELRPRLRSHAQIHRQMLRGHLWYVLQDHASNRFHRFSPAAYLVIGLMDGERSLEEIWLLAASELGDDCPTQDECIQLLARLHGADVLHCDVPPDVVELSQRSRGLRRRRRLAGIRSPLAIRIPLVDPDRFLTATLPFVRPLFGWLGLVIWLLLIGYGILLGALHWTEFTANISDRVLAADNLLLLWLAFPFVKALHELGHGYATKAWGGEVHEMGIMFLVFMPVPYVEASAASAFPEKWRRVVVGAAGMLVEMPLAALAMWVWVEAEPGMLRAIAYNVVLIAGVSTLLFNGNPLLRFDGYYILSDLIEIPNLGTRGNRYVGYLIQRYAYGVRNAVSSANSDSERPRLAVFAVASFCYRLVILVAIASFVATKFFIIGILLAVWSAVLMFVWPLAKSLVFLFTNQRLQEKRMRAIGTTSLFAAGVLGFAFFVPVPFATTAEGVIWAPEGAMVRTGTSGVVEAVVAAPNDSVETGQTLVIMTDPILTAEVRVLEAQLRELHVRYEARVVQNLVDARIIEEEIRHVDEQLALTVRRARDLQVVSPTTGKFIIRFPVDLPGRYFRRGELVGFVMDYGQPIIRVIVPQEDIDLVRNNTERVDMRLARKLAEVVPATIRLISPAPSNFIPNPALSTEGGGWVSLDPRNPKEGKSMEELYYLELESPVDLGISNIGGRVYVRFDHGKEPIAWQMYRRLRQIFLERFNV